MDYVDHANFGASEYDESKWFKNTLDKVAFPDPQVIEVGDTYYIYGTTDRTGSKTLDCYSTKDFNNFELHMDIYKPQKNGVKVFYLLLKSMKLMELSIFSIAIL